MMIHISLGGLITIHAEGARAYGRRPVWQIARFGREYILDMPFCRVIVTPGLKAGQRSRTGTNSFNRKGWNSDDTEKPPGPDRNAAGTTGDRP